MLYRTTLPAEYVALAKPLGIASTVTIEASARLEDNQWVLNLAAMNPVITGFVGNLTEVLGTAGFNDALSTLAANPLVRGIRVSPAQLNAANMANFALLAQKGLMIDVLGSPSDLLTVSAFAKSLPSLRIVIDHVANVKIDGNAPPSDWVSISPTKARRQATRSSRRTRRLLTGFELQLSAARALGRVPAERARCSAGRRAWRRFESGR